MGCTVGQLFNIESTANTSCCTAGFGVHPRRSDGLRASDRTGVAGSCFSAQSGWWHWSWAAANIFALIRLQLPAVWGVRGGPAQENIASKPRGRIVPVGFGSTWHFLRRLNQTRCFYELLLFPAYHQRKFICIFSFGKILENKWLLLCNAVQRRLEQRVTFLLSRTMWAPPSQSL